MWLYGERECVCERERERERDKWREREILSEEKGRESVSKGSIIYQLFFLTT